MAGLFEKLLADFDSQRNKNLTRLGVAAVAGQAIQDPRIPNKAVLDGLGFDADALGLGDAGLVATPEQEAESARLAKQLGMEGVMANDGPMPARMAAETAAAAAPAADEISLEDLVPDYIPESPAQTDEAPSVAPDASVEQIVPDFEAPQTTAAPQQAVPAAQDYQPGTQATEMTGNRRAGGATGAETSPEYQALVQRSAGITAKTQQMFNNGASEDDIVKYWVSEGLEPGLKIDQLRIAIRARDNGQQVSWGVARPEVLEQQPDTPPAPVQPEVSTASAFGYGTGDGLLVGASDEVFGALDATSDYLSGLTGTKDAKDIHGYEFYRDRYRGLLDASEEQHPWATMTGQVIGTIPSLFYGGAEVRGLAAAGRYAPRLAEGAEFLARGGARAGAISGAVQGGIYGFNSSNGNFSDRLADGAKTAAIGGVLGGSIGSVTRAFRPGTGDMDGVVGKEVMDAADDLNRKFGTNIQPLPAHVADGNLVPRAHTLSESGFTGGMFLTKPTERFADEAGKAKDAIVNDFTNHSGQNLDDIVSKHGSPGVEGTLQSYRKDSGDEAGLMFDEATRRAGDTLIETPRTVAALDALIRRYERQKPPGWDKAVELRDRLKKGGATLQELRDDRALFRKSLPQDGSANNDMVNAFDAKVWHRFGEDIDAGLRQAGKNDAALAHRQATAFYRDRAKALEIVEKIVGKADDRTGSGTIVTNLRNMSRSDAHGLKAALGKINPSRANEITGAFIGELGRVTDNGTNAGFSLARFLTQWDDKSMARSVKEALFDPNVRDSLDKLAVLARAAGRVTKEGNPSQSGKFVGRGAELATAGHAALKAGTAVVSGGSAIAAAAPTAALWSVWGLVTPKLLASPGVAKWMVAAASGAKVQKLARMAESIVARTPTLQHDMGELMGAYDRTMRPADVAQTPASTETDQSTDETAEQPVALSQDPEADGRAAALARLAEIQAEYADDELTPDDSDGSVPLE